MTASSSVPPPPPLSSTTTTHDPLGDAIAQRGVDDDAPLADTSHPVPHRVQVGSDSGDDSGDDVVVFDSQSLDKRTSIESISFGFKDNLLPLSLSMRDDEDDDDDARDPTSANRSNTTRYGDVEGYIEAGQAHRTPSRQRRRYRDPERRMGLIDGIALTVGLQIGSGIFSSPGVVTFNTGSIGASLLIWLLSGVLAWTGASSFAELGAAIPQNGGAQAYLNYSFGGLTSYLFSWTAIVALKPGSGAIIAIIFGEYLARIIFHSTSSGDDAHQQGLEAIPDWSIKLIACVVVILVSALNALSARLGTKLQVTTTVLKLGGELANERHSNHNSS